MSNSAPLLACRKALEATYNEAEEQWDIEAALKHLRLTEGAKTKRKTEGRAMGEGAFELGRPSLKREVPGNAARSYVANFWT